MPQGIDDTIGNEKYSSWMLSICYFSVFSMGGPYLPAQAAGFGHKSGLGEIDSWTQWDILQFPFPWETLKAIQDSLPVYFI